MEKEVILKSGREVMRKEAEALENMADRLDDAFCEAVNAICASKGRVIVCGVGKSGLIGKKIAATLASTGTPAFFLHAAEALHGDLGMVTKEDVLILVSHSGETPELLAVQTALTELGALGIAIVGNPSTSIGEKAQIELITGVCQEADHLNLVPSNSTTAALVMGDALALVLSKRHDFSRDDFARCHPGGNLGAVLHRERRER